MLATTLSRLPARRKVMRIALIVAAATLVTAPALAEPHKPVSRDSQPQQRSAPVILAAAETPPAPTADSGQQSQTPAKRRVGRITTCRCGDPQPGEQSPER
jgi:hypothetical protein